MVGHLLHRVLVGIDVEMRRDDEEVDAVEFLAIRPTRVARELQKRVERDDRLGVRRALADHAGPHGVVQFRIVVRHFCSSP